MFRKVLNRYSTNAEYRQSLREFFDMKPIIDSIPTGIDEESYDELLYDTNAVENRMNIIFENTKGHIEFQKIYTRAAATMLTEDLETGLAICLSYHHFYMFSIYLYQFYTDFENWKALGTNNELYKEFISTL